MSELISEIEIDLAWEDIKSYSDMELMGLIAITNKDFPNKIPSLFKKYSSELAPYKIVLFNKKSSNSLSKIFLNKTKHENILPIGGYSEFLIICVDSFNSTQYQFSSVPVVYLDTNVVSNMYKLIKSTSPDISLSRTVELISYIYSNHLDISIYPYIIENMTKYNNNILESTVISESAIIANTYMKHGLQGMSKLTYENGKLKTTETDLEYFNMIRNTFKENNVIKQKLLYAILLKSFVINMSSNVNVEKKLIELVVFINQNIGFTSEVALLLMKGYFEKEKKLVPFVKPLNNRSYNKNGDIISMSWDIYVYEETSSIFTFEDLDVCFPVIATFDKGFKTLIEYNPLNMIVFNSETGRSKKIHTKSISSIEYDSVLRLIVDQSDERAKVGANVANTIDATIKHTLEEYNSFFK